MNQRLIFLPMAALAGLTFIVLLTIPLARIAASLKGRVAPNDFRLGESERVPDDVKLTNRNYMNLLELPMLFYVLGLSVFVTQRVDGFTLSAAWLYFALRVAHSAVHLTYNNVIHRLACFATSNIVLVIMWVRFALTIASE